MPFTPFHFGPAALIKAILPRNFSLVSFCLAQVVIDIEVAYKLATHQYPLHGLSHTYLGALILGVVSGFLAMPAHSIIGRLFSGSSYSCLLLNPFTVRISLISGLLGTLSHVALDSLMHPDMTPLAPFSKANSMLEAISVDTLHLFCMATGIVGLIWCGVLAKKCITNDIS